MSEGLILIWKSYISNKDIKIGILIKKENDYYFKYFKEGIQIALNEGCMKPFPIDNYNKIIEFNKLPLFFEQRIVRKEKENNIYFFYNQFKLLEESKGIKNGDSFYVVSINEFIEEKEEEINLIK